MSTDTTLNGIAQERWGISLEPLQGRFAQPGWSFDSSLADRCPSCDGEFECCRKPYTPKDGTEQKYIALVCLTCRTACGPKDVNLKGYASLTLRHPSLTDDGSGAGDARAPSRPRTAKPAASAPPKPPRPTPPRPTKPPAEPRATTPRTPPPHRVLSPAAAVIEYWRTIELFEAQDVSLPTTADRADGIRAKRFLVQPGDLSPWEELQAAQHSFPFPVGFTVFGGIYRKDDLHTAMAAAVGDASEEVDERVPRGHSALFSLEVDAEGVPDLGSVVMASAPWALGHVLQGPEADPWQDVERSQRAFTERLAGMLGQSVEASDDDEDEAEPRPLTGSDIDALCRAAAAFLGVSDVLAPHGSVVTRYRVASGGSDTRADGFLNSMLVQDLERVARDIEDAGGPTGALGAYMGRATPSRTDVAAESSRDQLEELGSPAMIPDGRWPSPVDQPLSTSQQWAVNAISAMGSSPEGLFGVNGPPGTGKSTLLRDVVADVVTTRAHALAQLRDPADAFTSQRTGWSTESWTHSFPTLVPSITGHEVIVASSNNGAVENVSRELPDRSQLAEEWTEQTYVVDAARRSGGDDAWGLLAAVLGNTRNRSEFVSRVWWGNPRDGDGSRAGGSRPLFIDEMQERGDAHTRADWTAAVSAFTAAVAREAEVRTDRQRVHALLQQERMLQSHLHESLRQEESHYAHLAQCAMVMRDAEAALLGANEAFQLLDSRRQRSLEERPSWWESLWDLGAARRRWRDRNAALNDEIDAHNVERLRCVQAMDDAQSAHTAAQARLDEQRTHTGGVRANLASCARQLEEPRAQRAFQLPEGQWWDDPERQETRPPWVDEEWNRARTEVFLAALQLHEAFMVGSWTSGFKHGVSAAMDVVKGAPGGASAQAVTEAWRYLFLLVPVVSTTFASMGRMFAQVPARSFGWLVIDEAGQAAPQAAVGGIWRTQRTVAVGDPLQLEPIVSAMNSTQGQLRRLWDVDSRWAPGRSSVQRMADSATWLGTSISAGAEEDLWVGAPLRAHRRCDEPMFSIVNDAVYDGVMVQADPARGYGAEPRSSGIPGSAWLDVAASSSQGKWRPQEGEVLIRVIEALRRRIPLGEIMVISPYKDVAARAATLLGREGISVDAEQGGATVGTVHTAQGKQAEAVIFILGSDPHKEGSRQWAASKPNLMNVAVSRAKHAIYVIGERNQWAHLPYFDVMAQRLRTVDGAEVAGRDRS